MNKYDVIVIGAGIVGSSTAFHLAKDGYKTLLIEQFSQGHSRGSSGGHSRITRYSYAQQHYADMMPEAFAFIEQLERDIKQQLFVECGLLTVAEKNTDLICNTRKCLQNSKRPHHVLDGSGICAKYPGMTFDDSYTGLFEPSGGVLKADKCLKAIQDEFLKYGGELHDEEPVLDITPGNPVKVKTCKHTYTSSSLVLAAGAWTNKLLKCTGVQLPLEPQRIKVLYWKKKHHVVGLNKFPTIILETEAGIPFKHMYSLPALEYPDHVKLCVHHGHVIDPDERDILIDDTDEQAVARVIREHFPGLHDKASIKEICMYTMTPDRECILDRHPNQSNIIIGTGFSGSGFKLGPVVGRILGELATKKKPSYSVKPFSISRFEKKAKL